MGKRPSYASTQGPKYASRHRLATNRYQHRHKALELCWICPRPGAVRLIKQGKRVVERHRLAFCWLHLLQGRRGRHHAGN